MRLRFLATAFLLCCSTVVAAPAEESTKVLDLRFGTKLAPGSKFPPFKLSAVDGSVVDSGSLRGRYALLNFYFAACAPCVEEIPKLNEFSSRNKRYALLAVTDDSADETRKFVQKTKFGWTILADAKSLTKQAGVYGFPTFILLDPSGVVVATGTSQDVWFFAESLDHWISDAITKRTK